MIGNALMRALIIYAHHDSSTYAIDAAKIRKSIALRLVG
jgi:hypothetical protein